MASTKAKKKVAIKRKRITMRIFSRVYPNSCGSLQACSATMPSARDLNQIFKGRTELKVGKPIPKSFNYSKLSFRPKPDLYDLVNGWKAK